MRELHHSDIITYSLTRLASHYARDKQEILRDLKNCSSAQRLASPAQAKQPASYAEPEKR